MAKQCVLLTVLLLGLVLRLTGREVQSLWIDETMTVFISKTEVISATLQHDRHPPLSFFAFNAWITAFGEADGSLRLFTALVGSASLIVFFILARLVLTGWSYVLGVALFALSPFSIWYAQEVRGYVFLEFFALLALLGLFRVLSATTLRLRDALLLALGTAGAIGSHYMGALLIPTVIVALAVGLLYRHISPSVSLLAIAWLALGVLVWVPWITGNIRAQLSNPWGWTAGTSFIELLELPVDLLLVEPDVLPRNLWALGYVFGALVLGTLLLCVVRVVRTREKMPCVLLVSLSVPIVTAYAVALIGPRNFMPKYLLISEFGVIFALVLGLESVRSTVLRVGVSAYILGFCLTIDLLHKTHSIKDDFKAACAEVAQNWRPGDGVVSVTGALAGFSESPVTHYLRDHPAILDSLIYEHALAAGANPPESGLVHVVYRDSAYSEGVLKRILSRGELKHEGALRNRVQYIQVFIP